MLKTFVAFDKNLICPNPIFPLSFVKKELHFSLQEFTFSLETPPIGRLMIEETLLPVTHGPEGSSFIALLLQADWVVKGVVLLLIIASVLSWSIIFSKYILLRNLQKEADYVLSAFPNLPLEKWESRLSPKENGPFGNLLRCASSEWHNITSRGEESRARFQQRLDQMLQIHIQERREDLKSNMGLLFSIGSSAFLVGLFGTVWGVIHSFQGIASTKNNSLSVVAPGIAEALFVTAIGLVVTICAAVAYNRLMTSIHAYIARMQIFAHELSTYCLG